MKSNNLQFFFLGTVTDHSNFLLLSIIDDSVMSGYAIYVLARLNRSTYGNKALMCAEAEFIFYVLSIEIGECFINKRFEKK